MLIEALAAPLIANTTICPFMRLTSCHEARFIYIPFSRYSSYLSLFLIDPDWNDGLLAATT